MAASATPPIVGIGGGGGGGATMTRLQPSNRGERLSDLFPTLNMMWIYIYIYIYILHIVTLCRDVAQTAKY